MVKKRKKCLVKGNTMLFIFELEGVLCDTKILHFRALNLALRPFGESVPWLEHASPSCYHHERILGCTRIPASQRKHVWSRKQAYVFQYISEYPFKAAYDWVSTLRMLAEEGHRLACCAWEHPKMLMFVLMKLEILDLLDVVLSVEDAKNLPPHPEMLWDAMALTRTDPSDTLVVVAEPREIPGMPNVVTMRNARDPHHQMSTMISPR